MNHKQNRSKSIKEAQKRFTGPGEKGEETTLAIMCGRQMLKA